MHLKQYWAILNKFLNNKKIPTIPPLLVDGNTITNFSIKADLFNNFFASQCTPLANYSTLPHFNYKTDKRITSLDISDDDICLIIKKLNPNKAHGWDNISIRMIQLCGKSIAFPLRLIFESCLNDGIFPDDWKKVM